MIFERLRVFVSSRMAELRDERLAIRRALGALELDAWLFEDDAGARPGTVESVFLDEVERADLFIAVFWKGYGPYTIEEPEHARRLGRDCLIFEKRVADGSPRDPRLAAFLDRLNDVRGGLTIAAFDDAAELEARVRRDVAAWQTRTIRARTPTPTTPGNPVPEDRPNQLILLDRVKKFWVEGVLERSVHEAALLEPGRERAPDAVEHPWEQVLEVPGRETTAVRPGTRTIDVFDDAGRMLLILGAPGSGKTTTALELTRDLVRDAERDPAKPIPVVFNLSSWADARLPLAAWLAAELKTKYQIPDRFGRPWIEQNRVLPVLDGLDEVDVAARAACVGAINAFTTDVGVPGLVVCSRLDEYTALPERLKLTGAIRLLPLTDAQVDSWLDAAGPSLAGLREMLRNDESLHALARSPLMLDVMRVAWRDQPAVTPDAVESTGARGRLFDAYVDKVLARKGRTEQANSSERTVAWLSWLAARLDERAKTIFLIEELQPSWLASPRDLWLYALISRFAGGVLLSVLLAPLLAMTSAAIAGAGRLALVLLVWPLTVGVLDAIRLRRTPEPAASTPGQTGGPRRGAARVMVLYAGLGIVIGAGILAPLAQPEGSQLYNEITGAFGGLMVGVAFGLLFGLRGIGTDRSSDIRTTEALEWSWKGAGGGLLRGAGWGLLVGLLLGLGYLLVILPMGVLGVAAGIIYLAIAPPVGAALGGLLGILRGGWRPTVLAEKTIPNQGIVLTRRRVRNVLGIWVLGFAAVGAAFGLFNGLSSPADAGEVAVTLLLASLAGAIAGLFIGLLPALMFGGLDVIRHYTLRYLLRRRGSIPRRYDRFLDFASERILLRRVGGGWIFVHRLLLDHFARLSSRAQP